MSHSLHFLQDLLGYTFKDQKLITLALTHRSFASQNNERLEFLGDSILNAIVSEVLFERFPLACEGKLSRLRSRLVKGATLAGLARTLSIGKYLRLGLGEVKNKGFLRESILADALESLIGAIYLDGGMALARSCVLKWLHESLEEISIVLPQKDPKTRLQELMQSRVCELPHYEVVDIRGEPHSRVFSVECQISLLNQKISGKGSSKRFAEQEAASATLYLLGADKIDE